ncbi:alpha/beta hydrolase [Candidatus Saccharibacteria bacterium]|nr:MAG: alpha/beta hydrolase [Candidatus Saccharibacteria bacterium]
MTRKAVILHGTEGYTEGNWFRWLETQLKRKAYDVWLPQLPNSEHPSLRKWLDFVHENAPFPLAEDTVLIGHSSGASLALLIAQENPTKLKSVVCVSVFTNECGKSVATDWEANAKLFDVPYNWPKITEKVENQIVIVHSDDDPYVPLKQAEYIAGKLGAALTVIPGQGHFNLEKSHEYSIFPLLIDLLDKGVPRE